MVSLTTFLTTDFDLKNSPDSETSDVLMTHGVDDMIINGEKNSFRRMMFDIGRLERI